MIRIWPHGPDNTGSDRAHIGPYGREVAGEGRGAVAMNDTDVCVLMIFEGVLFAIPQKDEQDFRNDPQWATVLSKVTNLNQFVRIGSDDLEFP